MTEWDRTCIETAHPTAGDMGGILELLRTRTCTVLTGAGCSTESGIPDYRGPDGRLRARLPMRFQEFMADPAARTRYWARSAVGWPRFSAARPNDAHRALAALEVSGCLQGVITQNVDGLHQAAGSRSVVDLHGSLGSVRCMTCDATFRRDGVQVWLRDLNPGFGEATERYIADGDAALPPGAERGFRIPDCPGCGGILKPDVVFFGESVPKPTLDAAWRLFERGEALLVVGSSLTVFSGRRFVLRAQQEGKPVVIVNQGPTRGDEAAVHKVEERAGAFLSGLALALAFGGTTEPPSVAR